MVVRGVRRGLVSAGVEGTWSQVQAKGTKKKGRPKVWGGGGGVQGLFLKKVFSGRRRLVSAGAGRARARPAPGVSCGASRQVSAAARHTRPAPQHARRGGGGGARARASRHR